MSERLQRILSLANAKETTAGQFIARCPVHDDRSASLSIGTGKDGRVLLHCQTGKCSPMQIVAAYGLRMTDLMPPKSTGQGSGTLVATYDYTDADGVVLYQSCRFMPKDFKQRRPDGKGGWLWNMQGVARVLYHLPEIVAADPSTPILIVEGEKDADNLRKLGFVATCNPGGAGKWSKLSSDSALDARPVAIIPDADPVGPDGRSPGLDHALAVAHARTGKSKSVKIVRLPSGKDASDWIAAGGTADQLRKLIDDAPEFDPAAVTVNKPATQATLDTAVTDDDARACVQLGERDPESGRIVLSPRRTLPTATAYVKEFHNHSDGRTIHAYGGAMWRWQDNRYTQLEESEIQSRLQPWLHDALRYVKNNKTGELELVDFESNNATIVSALDAIRSYTHVPSSVVMPSWVGQSEYDASDVLPCKSCNLHIPTLKKFAATPKLFNSNAIDFDYDRDAPDPVEWLTFLASLWPNDQQQIDTLQEWFGYMLTADTSQQKIMLMVGPKRSGKGTIARVLRQLVGVGNVAGPTTTSLAGLFGLQPLIGKSLAIVSDARFNGEGVQTVVERLLCISGEDTLTIDRKHRECVTMKLPTRFMLLTNELPRMNDASGALAGRFIMLRMVKSFYGKEDHGLERRLFKELPGILLWSLLGWCRLRDKGRFAQPESVADAVQELEDLSSPVGAFVRDRCDVGSDREEYVTVLFEAWKKWCEAEGRSHATTKQVFGRDLGAVIPGLTTHQGSQGRFYKGVELRSEAGAMF